VPLEISAVIPTHNPDPARLRGTLLGLRGQTMPGDRWETVLVDNASVPPIKVAALAGAAPVNFRCVREPNLGLASARQRGMAEARGAFLVLVDDDNVLDSHYLAQVAALFAEHPRVGALGGKSVPEFAVPPAEWVREFFSLLALRDLGEAPLLSHGLRPPGATRNTYPACAPIGAGMGLRRAAAEAWRRAVEDDPRRRHLDRRGTALVSGGDNDIVLTIMAAGWEVAYFPQLVLTHLIPGERLEADYLARLNRSMQKSWMQLLSLHEANPWPRLSPPGAVLRKLKAWITRRAWSSPAARIRWQGACGHFDGRVTLSHGPTA
jgi:glycosyltransferase involved in cell wall biosynthesis